MIKKPLSIKETLTYGAMSLEKALKNASPVRTGALRQSIDAEVGKNTIEIEMFSYGLSLDRYSTKWKGWMDHTIDKKLDDLAQKMSEDLANQISNAINIR